MRDAGGGLFEQGDKRITFAPLLGDGCTSIAASIVDEQQ
jgi:hypothetical protein